MRKTIGRSLDVLYDCFEIVSTLIMEHKGKKQIRKEHIGKEHIGKEWYTTTVLLEIWSDRFQVSNFHAPHGQLLVVQESNREIAFIW